jgi:hypothetical protein
MASGNAKPEVVAIYCPLWHNYDHASSWKSEGWCEWELLKSAVPRFEGHHQPLEPDWGCFDESDPVWADREVSLAADHGVSVFLFDWYWYNGVRIMEEALERGFLRAPNRSRVKFALMWANHHWADYFPAPYGKPWNSWLPSRHSERDLFRVINYCIDLYFRQPNYWTVDDRLFFSLFEPLRFVEELGGIERTRKMLWAIDEHLIRAGLPPMHWNAMVWDPSSAAALREAGFRSATNYNVTSSGKIDANLTERYEDLVAAHPVKWQQHAQAPLPYFPVVTMGWDVTPRCEKQIPWPFPPAPGSSGHAYPYGPVVTGNTPGLFKELCQMARDHIAQTPSAPNAVFINAWNEWTEGCYLLPEKRHGLAYLEAVKDVFHPKNT